MLCMYCIVVTSLFQAAILSELRLKQNRNKVVEKKKLQMDEVDDGTLELILLGELKHQIGRAHV